MDCQVFLSCQDVRCLLNAMQRCRRRHANMSVMVNGAAVLEYGNHLPSFHEPSPRFAVRATIPDKEKNDVFVLDSLIPFMPDKNAEVVLMRVPPVRNQAAVLVQASGRRQIIAVLQDGGAVMRRAIQDGCAVGCSLAIAINRPFSFYLESSAHRFWRRAVNIKQRHWQK